MKKVNVTLSLYFEISDSEVYGGKGEIGYAHTNIDLVASDLRNINLEELVKGNIEGYAELCKVPEENVKIIPRKVYEENTEDD